MTPKNNESELKRLIASDLSKYDLTHLVERAIEPFGRYQKFVFIALCTHSIISAICTTITAFHIYTPEEFRCVEEAVQVCIFHYDSRAIFFKITM